MCVRVCCWNQGVLRNITTHLRKYRDLNTGFCVHALQSTPQCQELFESCLISQTGVKTVISAAVMSFHFSYPVLRSLALSSPISRSCALCLSRQACFTL